jgi:hypothetical protein
LVALDQLSNSQDILILHLKDRVYNKKPAHVLQKQEELNVKCALNMLEDRLNNFLQLLIALSAGGWL